MRKVSRITTQRNGDLEQHADFEGVREERHACVRKRKQALVGVRERFRNTPTGMPILGCSFLGCSFKNLREVDRGLFIVPLCFAACRKMCSALAVHINVFEKAFFFSDSFLETIYSVPKKTHYCDVWSTLMCRALRTTDCNRPPSSPSENVQPTASLAYHAWGSCRNTFFLFRRPSFGCIKIDCSDYGLIVKQSPTSTRLNYSYSRIS